MTDLRPTLIPMLRHAELPAPTPFSWSACTTAESSVSWWGESISWARL